MEGKQGLSSGHSVVVGGLEYGEGEEVVHEYLRRKVDSHHQLLCLGTVIL